jgi:hypothetical protein
MKFYRFSFFIAALLIFTACKVKNDNTKSEALASKPPMGWNSFDSYDSRINEEQFRRNVDFMADSLLRYGWNYAVIDYIWWHPDPGNWQNPKRRYGHPDIRYSSDGRPVDTINIDKFGRLLPAVERFPSSAGGKGFKPIADYVHSKGMKFGIHIMRGVHRKAAYYKLPIKGTDLTCDGIADITDTCNWCNHMYGVDSSRAGAQEYYNSLFELYASWEIDFVKVDDILAPQYQQGEIEMIRKAIDKCGRPIVLSLSPGEAPITMADHLATNANMWRISADFWDEWDKLKHNFELLEKWYLHIRPGAWPDADMLPVGRLSLDGRPHGAERDSHFTWPEHYTLFSLWMISRSPLIMGGDLPSSKDSTLIFMMNPETIAVNQNSTGNKQLFRDERKAAWIADDPDSGGKYLAYFNLTDTLQVFEFDLQNISLTGAVKVRDLWARKDIGNMEGKLNLKLEPHGAILYKLTKTD